MRDKIIPFAAVLLVVSAAVPAPAAALSLGDSTADASYVQYSVDGQLRPSFIVEYDNGSLGSVQDWANSSSSRKIISVDKEAHQAIIAAPAVEVTSSFWARLQSLSLSTLLAADLSEQGYIKDVSPNYVMSYAEPVSSFTNESQYAAGTIGLTALNDPDFSKSGMAFSGEANRTTMAESRKVLGVDEVSATGDDVTVAVVDTGANTANGRIFGNGTIGSDIRIKNASKNFLTGETVSESGYDAIADGNGHGTWTASAIAANHSNNTWDGVAPDASLLVLKALSDDGSGSTADIAQAIRYAADHNADVISMSIGSPIYSEELSESIQYALDNGVSAVIVAVGNSRQTVRWVATPADVEGVIGVGATTGENASNAQSAYFSQIGPDPGTTDSSSGKTQGAMVDVAAPGMKTVAAVATESGNTQKSELSGTSMATPMVAGGIALAIDEDASLRGQPKEVKKVVTKSAKPMPHAAQSEVGHGMFAVDNLVTETYPETSQTEAMTTNAKTRDTYYESLSDASGGWLPLATVSKQLAI